MQEQDPLIDREAWRRLLARDAGEPPRATDERIRAAAREALAPHAGRWWLPASLAASLLLAVLVVQWQYEGARAPAPLTESDVAPAAPREETAAAQDAFANAPAEAAAEAAGAPAADMPPPPMMDLPVLPESASPPMSGRSADMGALSAPAEVRDSAEPARERAEIPPAQPTARPVPAAAPEREAPAAGIAAGELRTQKMRAAEPRTPEAWYAEIERLRAAGRDEEAEAELEKLEEAHPGWLAKHLAEER